MRERELARSRSASTAEDARRGDGMVRGAEGTCAHQRTPVQKIGGAVHLRHLDRFIEAERRQNARDPARHHGLAGAGRTDQKQVVAARRGDLQRALRVFLTADLGEIGRRSELGRVGARRR